MIVQRVLIPASSAASGLPPIGEDVATEAAPLGEERHEEPDPDHDHQRPWDARFDLQAARRFGDAPCRGELRGEARRPVVAVGDPDGAEDEPAADHAEQDLGPHRPEGEAELASLPAGVEQQEDDTDADGDAQDPAHGPAERAGRPTAEQHEGGIVRGDRRPAAEDPDDPAEDEQATEGHDERRHADVGDEEALEPADQGAEREARRRGRRSSRSDGRRRSCPGRHRPSAPRRSCPARPRSIRPTGRCCARR